MTRKSAQLSSRGICRSSTINDGGRAAGKMADGTDPTRRSRNRIAFAFEEARQDLAKVRVIIDDENARLSSSLQAAQLSHAIRGVAIGQTNSLGKARTLRIGAN